MAEPRSPGALEGLIVGSLIVAPAFLFWFVPIWLLLPWVLEGVGCLFILAGFWVFFRR